MRLARGIHYGLISVWLILALCVCARPAYAYADPGAGLFLMQFIGSTLLGFALLIRKRIVDFIARLFKNEKQSPTDIAP